MVNSWLPSRKDNKHTYQYKAPKGGNKDQGENKKTLLRKINVT
jgi:hypothetical protein